MRRRLSVIGLVVGLALIVAAIASSRKQATVTIISPPEGVSVPAGQAVEVRYRVDGPAQGAGLQCDDGLAVTDLVPAGQELRRTWIPGSVGRACCTATALDGRGAALASARRCLDVGPGGSPVRLDGS